MHLLTPAQLAATDPRAQRMAAGIIGELMAADVVGLRGSISVEIIDPDSGRVLDRLDSRNYVNTGQWNEFAKALQKLVWTYGYQGDTSTVTNNPYTNRDPRILPTLRNDHVACWTDSTAENTADLYALGEVTAWAHRWQQGSPSTRQGLVQPALCTLTASAVKWVWEWTTANGNGTFQSVGWRRLAPPSNSGDTVMRDMPHISRRLRATTGYSGDPVASFSTASTWTSGATNQAGMPVYFDSGSGKLYFEVLVSGTLVRLCSVIPTIDANGDFTLGAVTDESGAAFAAGLGGDNVATSTRFIQGITRLGSSGDWIAAGRTGLTTARRPTIRRVTNAGSVTYTNANGGTYSVESGFSDVTYDGTDLWVTAQNGSTGAPAIHRIDPANGNITATISTIAGVPAYFPQISSGRGVHGIEWDADAGWLWVTTTDGYLCNIDTSGNWLGVLFHNTATDMPISPSTLSGQHNNYRANPLGLYDTDDIRLTGGNSGSGTDADDENHPYHQAARQNWTSGWASATTLPSFTARLFSMDGDVWAQPAVTNQQDGTPVGVAKHLYAAFTQLPHFASRSLLASPATKTSANAMRISYTMTFT